MDPVNQAALLSTTTTLPAVTLAGDKAVADTRDIAAYFKRTHKAVLVAVRTALARSPEMLGHKIVPMFDEVGTGNGASREVMAYRLDRDAFSLIVMGFTGEKAFQWKLAYIDAFNAMEAELRRRQSPAVDLNDPASLRTLLLGYSEQLIAARAEVAETKQALVVTEKRAAFAEAVIEEVRPKIEAYEAFLDADGLCTLSTAARAIDAPQKLFFAWLREKGYLFDADGFAQPRADLRKAGYMKIRWHDVTPTRREWRTYATKPGLEWLRQRWYVGPGQALRLQAAVANRQGELPGFERTK
ncbi:phage regulatory protein/antirepressor Ant [Methylobacterium indicum]|uniref:Antirepressor protein C-terminal domain-containing protein n=1 Tax=Methylobacterium indicum TaxID=1775910 RepID=A0A8H8WSN2_9HYPH|nr:phage regulatory protein/antirepressor Ant [Methylobacterium indicum]BCM83565.1 hypothetical protein mvi_20260 [Methylobacterium indicum]